MYTKFITRVLLCFLAVFLGFSCCRQTQPTTHTFPSRTFTISFDGMFTLWQRQTMISALQSYRAVGVRFVPTYGEPSVAVHFWTNTDPTNTMIGEWRYQNAIYIDPNRIISKQQLQAIILHELGHWFGLKHICVRPTELPTCYPIGYGEAIMNPFLSSDNITEFTSLDIAEFHRVLGQ